MKPSRRMFLKSSAAGAAAALTAKADAYAAEPPATAGTGPSRAAVFQPAPGQKYDLLVKGGDVLDPSQDLRGRRDIAIHNAHIAAVEPEISVSAAKQVLTANGRLVVPGLVDMHAHVYPWPRGSACLLTSSCRTRRPPHT